MEATTAAPAISASQDSSAPAQNQQPTASEKVKVKVNGRETEVDLATLTRDYQKYSAADERFRKASELEKKYGKYAGIEEKLSKKDLSWLEEELGEDFLRQYSEDYLLKWMEYNQLPEEAKENRKLKKELEDREKRLKDIEESRKSEELKRYEQQATQEIDESLAKVLSKYKNPTPMLAEKIARTMLAHLDAKGERMDTEQAYNRGLKYLQTSATEALSILPPEEAVKLIPKELQQHILRRSVDEVTSKDYRRKSQGSEADKAEQPRGEKGRFKSTDDWIKWKEKRLSGAKS